jgi:hypothetical protein
MDKVHKHNSFNKKTYTAQVDIVVVTFLLLLGVNCFEILSISGHSD